MTLRAVVTDLEGTTTSLAFVRDTLFPYASQALAAFVADHPQAPEVQAAIAVARAAVPTQRPADTLLGWIAQDRKIGELKALQGLIWRRGYQEGALRGHLWPDAVEGLQALARRGVRLAVFSSGSVEAQQLLFRHSVAGDLSGLIEAWFDTGTGPKRDAASYQRIAAALALPCSEVLFLSDVPAELDAARAAGMRTCCLERGEDGDPPPHTHRSARDFGQLAEEVEAPAS